MTEKQNISPKHEQITFCYENAKKPFGRSLEQGGLALLKELLPGLNYSPTKKAFIEAAPLENTPYIEEINRIFIDKIFPLNEAVESNAEAENIARLRREADAAIKVFSKKADAAHPEIKPEVIKGIVEMKAATLIAASKKLLLRENALEQVRKLR